MSPEKTAATEIAAPQYERVWERTTIVDHATAGCDHTLVRCAGSLKAVQCVGIASLIWSPSCGR